jgi:hypothetical protein
MKTKTKTITFKFDASSILLNGVSDLYADLLEDGMSSEEALHLIMEDTIVQYHLWKKYPKWAPITTTGSDGEFEIELEKIYEY